LRNPYRFARRPGTSAFFVNDVGENTWEEINRLKRGGNYGWNIREGKCVAGSATRCGPARGFVNPLYAYQHTRCRAITGGAFVPKWLWRGLGGAYLFADYTCDKIFRLYHKAGGGWRASVFARDLGGPSHLRFGPFGTTSALYYINHFAGEIRRIARVSTNTAPDADFSYRPDGLEVAFNGSRSADPDSGDRIAQWHWSFGDGDQLTTTQPQVTHTYASAQSYQVSLVVTDTHGRDSTATVRSVPAGVHPPSITIVSPSTTARFKVGQPFTATAEASDAEDGSLPGTSISWTVRLHHANHFHPYAGPRAGASISARYPAPEGVAAARNSMLVVRATAVDSHGLATTVTRQLLPKKVRLTFASRPAGVRLLLQDAPRQTPTTITSWVGWVFQVQAPARLTAGPGYEFVRWSHGRSRTHDLRTPDSPATYTAVYRRQE
jgi:hypothetical protein